MIRQSFNYVNEELLEEDLKCSICLEPLFYPRVHSCGNMFCNDHLKDLSQCPLCRTTLEQSLTNPPLYILNKLNSLKVSCPRCNSIQERGTFDDHMTKCPIECTEGCGEKVLPLELNSHKERCPKVIINCEAKDLSCNWFGARFSFEEHKKLCPFIPLIPILRSLKQENERLRIEMDTLKRQMILSSEFIFLKSRMNKFLSAIPDGSVAADKTWSKSWETFQLKQHFDGLWRITCVHGTSLGLEGSKIKTFSHDITPFVKWKIIPENNGLFRLQVSGKYLAALGDQTTVTSNIEDPNTLWEITERRMFV